MFDKALVLIGLPAILLVALVFTADADRSVCPGGFRTGGDLNDSLDVDVWICDPGTIDGYWRAIMTWNPDALDLEWCVVGTIGPPIDTTYSDTCFVICLDNLGADSTGYLGSAGTGSGPGEDYCQIEGSELVGSVRFTITDYEEPWNIVVEGLDALEAKPCSVACAE